MGTIMTGSAERVVKTVCSMCYCSCGVLARVKDGRVVKLEGDPDHPWSKGALCQNGDWVWVETIYFGDRERVRFKAKIMKGFPKQVVAVEHGWWYPEKEDPKHGSFDSNVNVVIPNHVYDPIFGSTNLRSVPCRVYKETATPLSV